MQRNTRSRKKPAGNQDDVFGTTPNISLHQAQNPSTTAPQSPVPMIAIHGHDPSSATKTADSTDLKPEDPTIMARPTRCARNGFKLELFYRDVEPNDERSDRRQRKREDLLVADTDKTSSIYRARHGLRRVDPALDHNYLVLEDDEIEDQGLIPAESVADPGGSPARISETTLNARAAKIKEIEAELLSASEGKLHPQILDVRPDGSMSPEDRKRWDKIAAEIVKDMSDTSTILGQLVDRIRKVHSGADGETRLANDFEAFANLVAARVAEVCRGSEDQPLSGLFKSSGTLEMEDGPVPYFGAQQKQPDNKLDIIVHGDHAEHNEDRRWDHCLTYGELKVEPWKDLRDPLLGQMLRYTRKVLQNHPISGRHVAFSLCAYLFRLLETNPVGFSTSACYDFRKPDDHIKIVTMIAYLAGAPFRVSQQWEPSPNQTITVRRQNHEDMQYRLSQVTRLAVSPTIWGRRTAVWWALVVPVDAAQHGVDSKGLPMVIKSTWLPKRCYTHELDICEVIDKARQDCLAADPTSYVPNLPIPIGQVISRIDNTEISLDGWETPDGSWQVSTLATFCEIGTHVDEGRITVANHIRLHTSLLRTLKWLAEAGIHYRDLNNGNVLRSTGDVVLIDFGNSRYLKRPRGQKDDKPAPELELSLDDAHSGTLMFMSRRIHALTDENLEYQRLKEALQAQLEASLGEEPSEFDDQDYDDQQKDLDDTARGLAEKARQHCYIDDTESQVYLMFQQMLYTTGKPNLFRDMEKLLVKRKFWEGRSVQFRGVNLADKEWMNFMPAIKAWRKSVDRCHKMLAAPSTGPDDGRITPHERQCFDELIEIMETLDRDVKRKKGSSGLQNVPTFETG